MKSTGISRKVDDLGRIVIPMELRNQLNIKEKDAIEIYVEGSSIVLKKFNQSCVFCGSEKDLKDFNGHSICKKCIDDISKVG